MKYRYRVLFLLLPVALSLLVSCASVSQRMPHELTQMHEFLTQDDPGKCRNYHYNYERQAPRLYHEGKPDSLLGAIDYIKTECGPAANLEVIRLLLLSEYGRFDDSLVGPATIPQMLWHRAEQEYALRWLRYAYLYGGSRPIDNTHDNFLEFRQDLAAQVAAVEEIDPSAQALGEFYAGNFDTAFALIQSDELQGSELQHYYEEYVQRTKTLFSTRGDIGFSLGSWRPQGDAELLGEHPEIGITLGGEGPHFRINATINYRFLSAENEFTVDSLGEPVQTDKFNSWLFGVDGGFKVIDNNFMSTDIFLGLGYDVIFSITEAGDPNEYQTHGSWAASFGVRQRFFVKKRTGFYVGLQARYSVVGYDNPGGTDLSGETVTLSLITGWSIHETLDQFLDKLNYKGSWRW